MVAQPDRIRETLDVNDAALDELARTVADLRRTACSSPVPGDSLAVAIARAVGVRADDRRAVRAGAEPRARALPGGHGDRALGGDRLSCSGETTRTVEALLVAQHAVPDGRDHGTPPALTSTRRASAP